MRRVTVDDAVKVIRSGDTILVGGSGGDHAVPEAPMAAVERRFPRRGRAQRVLYVNQRARAGSPRAPAPTAELRSRGASAVPRNRAVYTVVIGG